MAASDRERTLRASLGGGVVIPAHPLALTAERRLDERHQRALTRYYLDAGAGGIAIGVHTTQFAIRNPEHGLYRPVLALAAETARSWQHASGAPIALVAGAIGDTAQAVSEAEAAASLGREHEESRDRRALGNRLPLLVGERVLAGHAALLPSLPRG